MPSLDQIAAHFRLADLLDIAVITALLYVTLTWVRRRVSHAAVAGLALVGALYVAARALHMYLTLQLFQLGIALVLFSLVVIFQQDLRRGLERLASWRINWARAGRGPAHPSLDALAEAAGLLAERRCGALLVLKGREPLDLHVRGGIPLDGEISVPLLLSLFHSGTPGHDGAALIDRGRLEKFAVHLPLSPDLAQLRDRGTRHAAALGLAERTDALTIVVSEERGAISVAHEGGLTEVASPAVLKERLTRFSEGIAGGGSPRPLAWLGSQVPNVLLSAGLACLLWFSVAYRVERVEKPIEDVAVEYRNLPENWVIDANAPATMRLTVTGTERALQALDPKKLKVSVDLKGRTEGQNTIALTEDLLNLPQGVALLPNEVKTLELTLYRRVEVPVQATLERNTLPGGYSLGKVSINPPRVPLLIGQPLQSAPPVVMTEPINLKSFTEGRRVSVRLQGPPPFARFPSQAPPTVEVTIAVEKAKPGQQRPGEP